MVSYDDGAWELIEKWVKRHASETYSSALKTWIISPEPSKALCNFLPHLKNVEISQDFRPYYNVFHKLGYKLIDSSAQPSASLILMVATRQRQESLGLIALTLEGLGKDSLSVFACANAQGAPGFISQLRELNPNIEAESGNKSRLVAFRRDDIRHPEVLQQWLAEAQPTFIPQTKLRTMPGIYGWNKIDAGSRLLVSTLPALSGVGYDLGAGYGFLSHAALSHQSNQISELHLVEADKRALECARLNLSTWEKACHFHWKDIVLERSDLIQGARADWVLLNPPFHQGRSTEVDLGIEFIQTAASLLKKEGQLFMVANTFLPYEKVLSERFKKSTRVLEADGFKVIHGQR